jgi:hypothetical protein
MSVKEPNPSRVTLTPHQQQLVIDAAADLPLPKQTLLLSRVLARLSYSLVSTGYGPLRVSDAEVEHAITTAGLGLRQRLGATP